MARSLTVISLLFQSTTHCRYRVYTKFLLTYTAIYRRNRKILPLGITAFQPQSHFHLGTPYTSMFCSFSNTPHILSYHFGFVTNLINFKIRYPFISAEIMDNTTLFRLYNQICYLYIADEFSWPGEAAVILQLQHIQPLNAVTHAP